MPSNLAQHNNETSVIVMNKHVNSCEWDLFPSNTVRFMEFVPVHGCFCWGNHFPIGKKSPGEKPGRYRNTRECFRWLDEAKTGYVTRWGLPKLKTGAMGAEPKKHQDSWETVKETNGDEGFGDHEKGFCFHMFEFLHPK